MSGLLANGPGTMKFRRVWRNGVPLDPPQGGTPVRTHVRFAEAGAQDIAIRVTWSPVDSLPGLGGHRRETERASRLEARREQRTLTAAAAKRRARCAEPEPAGLAVDEERGARGRLRAGPCHEAVPAGRADDRAEARCELGRQP